MRVGMSRRCSVIAAIMVMGTASGCATSTAETTAAQPDRGVIGLAMPTTTFTRWVEDGESMVQQFELLGYDTDLRYAEDDTGKQIDQIKDMIADGDKALVIGAVDGTTLKDVLAEAAAADIPVISYDRLIRDSPDVDYYATFDNYKVGVLQGTAIVNALGLATNRKTFTIELFAGSPDDNNATFFFNGAMSVLRPYLSSGRLVVGSGRTALKDVAVRGWDGDIAAERMQQLLATTYRTRTLDAVLSPNDGTSRSLLKVLQARGGKLPVITGQDAEVESVKLVAAGTQTMTVYKDTRELAKVSVQMTDLLLTGGTPRVNDTTQYDNGLEVVPTFLLQPVAVTRANYQRVLIDSGYYTAAQITG